MEELLRRLREEEISVSENCPLAEHSTFRVGGFARAAAFPNTREKLVKVLNSVRDLGIRFIVMGNASNVVFSDAGFDGLVIFTGECKTLSVTETQICADCGVSLGKVATAALDRGLAGAEFLFGIPGTVGGGVFMNAGAFGGCMEQICVSSEYWDCDTGMIASMTGDMHQFGTRTSVYADNPQYILLGACFALTKGDAKEIRSKMDDYITRRKQTQPLEYPSAGSVFKRPVGYFAGKLIEDCGLKGLTVGGAQVSQKHAGFIINIGDATSADIKELVEQIKTVVLKETGVELECEIRFIE